MKRNIFLIVLIAFIAVNCEKPLLGTEPQNTPKDNLEVLWKTIDENYALFPVKNVNWDSLHAVYTLKVNANTSDTELWNIMSDLLSNLNDGHVNLIDKNLTKDFNSSAIAKRPANDFSLELIRGSYLTYYSMVGNGLITYGKIRDKNIGYIHIASFTSTVGDGASWASDIEKAINELKDCDAMIVDVRNNGGGLIVTEKLISSAFIDREIHFFNQRAKTGPGHNDFGDLIPIYAEPRPGKPTFTKKNIILTNRFSASGAEWFTQVFRNLSYSKQVGDTTFGAFGDIINRAQLPNGWTLTYPCRLTTTLDGKCYEGKGLVPDYLVENYAVDINTGNDKAIKFAIDYLSK